MSFRAKREISQTPPERRDSSGKLKVMVIKHTPLGEINLPSVASSANAPRCRRNRRQTESHQACLNGRGAKEGNSKLTDAIIPRRPCAGSLSPLGMTQECCRRRGRCWPQVHGAATVGAARRRQRCENRNILFIAHPQRIAHYYFSLFLIISHYFSLSLTPFRPCSTFAMSLDDKRVSAALAEHES